MFKNKSSHISVHLVSLRVDTWDNQAEHGGSEDLNGRYPIYGTGALDRIDQRYTACNWLPQYLVVDRETSIFRYI